MADEAPLFTLPEALVCLEIPEIPDPCVALFPGGATLEAPDLLELMQPALAPLMPLFDVLEAVVAIKNCIEAIPDAITQVSPQPILDCLPTLAQRVAKLLRLLPQVSLPVLIVQIIDCIAGRLREVRAFLVRLKLQAERLAAVVERAAELDDPNLSGIAACGSERLGVILSNEMKGLVVVGRLLGLLVTLFSLIGVDVDVPDLSALTGAPLDTAIEPLDAILAQLDTLRAAVPADLLEAAT